jgi:hypothetical protein
LSRGILSDFRKSCLGRYVCITSFATSPYKHAEAKSRRKQNFPKKMPIAAALILKGLTPGAALVFLMTGPATNAASFVTIWKILGRATALTYLATIAGCAILGGILPDYITAGVNSEAVTHHGWMLPQVVKNISAVVLLAVLVFAVLSKKKAK